MRRLSLPTHRARKSLGYLQRAIRLFRPRGEGTAAAMFDASCSMLSISSLSPLGGYGSTPAQDYLITVVFVPCPNRRVSPRQRSKGGGQLVEVAPGECPSFSTRGRRQAEWASGDTRSTHPYLPFGEPWEGSVGQARGVRPERAGEGKTSNSDSCLPSAGRSGGRRKSRRNSEATGTTLGAASGASA
jgi:hypothetical protein